MQYVHTTIRIRVFGIKSSEMVGRKIFLEHYSYALHLETFDPTSDSLNGIKWESLPICLKKFSYDNIIAWLGWIIDGKGQDKGNETPQEWLDF